MLKNAFGSVSHQLIIDMLKYIQPPSNFASYVSNIYSKCPLPLRQKNMVYPFSISQVGSCIYIHWDVPDHDDHDDPQGWYLATVLDHHINGQSVIQYPNGDTEMLPLKSTR